MTFSALSVAALGCAVTVAVVFGVAAVSKLRSRRHYREYRDSLAGLGWLPARLRPAAAAALVATELAVVALLAAGQLWPAARPAGFALAGVTLVVLAVGLAVPLRQGRKVRCRCFGTGTGSSPVGWGHVVVNAALAAVAAIGLAASLTTGVAALSPASVGAAAVAVAAAVAAIRSDDLAFLFGGSHHRDRPHR